MQKTINYNNRKLVGQKSVKYLNNYNPAEGKVYSLIPDSEKEDVEEAVKAATQAFPSWSSLPAEDRMKILLKAADLIDRDLDKLALAESIDNGKPVKLARTLNMPRASANIRFYATASMHFATEAHVNEGDSVNYTIRMPLGSVA